MLIVKKWYILNIMIHYTYFLRRAGQGRGTKIKSDKKGRGNHKKSDVSGDARGGMVAEQFDRRIMIL